MVKWSGKQNLYPCEPRLRVIRGKERFYLDDAWDSFWGLENKASLRGSVRYRGGDLVGRLRSAPQELTAEDFRLRPDSAGYQAGPDGRDLGANIDFVGPGEAYARWKQTPEYQDWLAEVRRLMSGKRVDN